MIAPSDEDEPRLHPGTAASYQRSYASPVDAVPSQRHPSPETQILGRCSLRSRDVEAADNDRGNQAEAEQSPHSQTTTEPAVMERGKIAASVRRSHAAPRNFSPPQRPQACASKQRPMWSADKPPVSDEQQARDNIIARYQEWPLHNATLKCVRENSTAIFQLRFT